MTRVCVEIGRNMFSPHRGAPRRTRYIWGVGLAAAESHNLHYINGGPQWP